MSKKKTWMLGFVMLSLSTGAQLLTDDASAGEACATIKSCHVLQHQIATRLADLVEREAQRGEPGLTEIARRGDKGCPSFRAGSGDICYMNQYRADSFCHDRGQRLPTARELALYAQSLGAEGVSDTAKHHFMEMSGSDSLGRPQVFYYSFLGYERPVGDLGNDLWSSSGSPGDSDFAFYLSGEDGNLDGGYRDSPTKAVRCLQLR